MEIQGIILALFLTLTGVCVQANNYPKIVMDQICGHTINTNSDPLGAGMLKLTSQATYPRGLDCNVTIQAPTGSHVLVYVSKIDVTPGPVGQHCPTDKLDFLENNIKKPLLINGICGTKLQSNEKTVRSDSNSLQLWFQSSASGKSGTGFTIIFTQFTIRAGDCFQTEYQCSQSADLACINKSLKCDGQVNCKDESDEIINFKRCSGMCHLGSFLLMIFACILATIAH